MGFFYFVLKVLRLILQFILTNKRLIFYAHGLNINSNLRLEFELDEIKGIEDGGTMIVSGKIKVLEATGNKYIFVVYGRKEWIKQIHSIALN